MYCVVLKQFNPTPSDLFVWLFRDARLFLFVRKGGLSELMVRVGYALGKFFADQKCRVVYGFLKQLIFNNSELGTLKVLMTAWQRLKTADSKRYKICFPSVCGMIPLFPQMDGASGVREKTEVGLTDQPDVSHHPISELRYFNFPFRSLFWALAVKRAAFGLIVNERD